MTSILFLRLRKALWRVSLINPLGFFRINFRIIQSALGRSTTGDSGKRHISLLPSPTTEIRVRRLKKIPKTKARRRRSRSSTPVGSIFPRLSLKREDFPRGVPLLPSAYNSEFCRFLPLFFYHFLPVNSAANPIGHLTGDP